MVNVRYDKEVGEIRKFRKVTGRVAELPHRLIGLWAKTLGPLNDTGKDQQIRGSGSPISMSMIRVPPKPVLTRTMPSG